MKYIASCSFGKDSLAMILTIIEHGLPLDEVVYCEVMFDDTTSGEYPEHAAFIHDNGCWFCHNARLNELHDLWKNHPDLWAELRCIQAISKVSFKQDYTIFDLEERFKKEEAQHEKAQETPAPGKAPDV